MPGNPPAPQEDRARKCQQAPGWSQAVSMRPVLGPVPEVMAEQTRVPGALRWADLRAAAAWSLDFRASWLLRAQRLHVAESTARLQVWSSLDAPALWL